MRSSMLPCGCFYRYANFADNRLNGNMWQDLGSDAPHLRVLDISMNALNGTITKVCRDPRMGQNLYSFLEAVLALMVKQ